MPPIEGVDTNAAALAAQVLSQTDTPESSPQDKPAMAHDLCCAANCERHSILLPHSDGGDVQIFVTTSSAGIQRLALTLKTSPLTAGKDESDKKIDEAKEGEDDPEKKIDETKEGEESGGVTDSFTSLEDAKTDLKATIENRYHSGRNKLPKLFSTLSETGKRTVFASAVDWVLSNSSERTPRWFAAMLELASEEGLVGYFTNTVQQHTYDKLDALPENRLVKSVIDAYGMRIK